MSSTILHGSGADFPVSTTVADQLLAEALTDFHSAYGTLTQHAHEFASTIDQTSAPAFAKADFGKRLRASGESLIAVGKRIHAVHDADAPADAIDRTALGPKVNEATGSLSVYISNDMSKGRLTHVNEINTGTTIFAGLNSYDGDDGTVHQPFVAITTEDAPEQYVTETGEPVLCVSISDADVYDNEGQGDRVTRISRNEIAQILNLTEGEGKNCHADPAEFTEKVDRIYAAMHLGV
jgi:hypothetical protein